MDKVNAAIGPLEQLTEKTRKTPVRLLVQRGGKQYWRGQGAASAPGSAAGVQRVLADLKEFEESGAQIYGNHQVSAEKLGYSGKVRMGWQGPVLEGHLRGDEYSITSARNSDSQWGAFATIVRSGPGYRIKTSSVRLTTSPRRWDYPMQPREL